MMKHVTNLAVLTFTLLMILGCGDKAPRAEDKMDQYRKQAKQEITAENAASELERIEQEIDSEL